MADIEAKEKGDGFQVTVTEGGSSTEHTVRVPEDYLAELGLAGADRRQLVEESFRFLLEREPKESILQSFELSVIERYFPEYAKDIRRRLGGT